MKTGHKRIPKKIISGRIAAEELARRSGVTERRLLQLADEGLLPKPDRGVYPEVPALWGLVKHWKELFERKRAMQDAIDQETLKAKQRENAEADGLLVQKAQVAEELQRSLAPIKDVLRSKLESELPVAMSGMAVPENRIVGSRVFDDICERFTAIFKKWKV